ncbi:hypothetical protein [Natronorubrum sp. FCH18a]|uniref:hypothetical protein n=1 Tax=Natronorubrum sp. FCH18a TaxID=3447018 RepID=UPI003F50FDD6
MTCPYLAYREESAEMQFAEPRAYCTAAERFVQPMRADVCNDRYDLAHDRHCEIFLEHADANEIETDPGTDTDSDSGAGAENAADDDRTTGGDE